MHFIYGKSEWSRNHWFAAIRRTFARLGAMVGITPRQAEPEPGSAESLASLSTETNTDVTPSVVLGGHYRPTVVASEAQEMIDANLFLNDSHHYEDSSADPSDYDEPEPLTEYNGQLTDPLYKPEIDDGKLVRNLNVDEIIACVKDVTDEQRNRIAEALKEYSPRKLSNLLRWMRGRIWTGSALLLFLEFRILWNENGRWKENYFWSEQLCDWCLNTSPVVLRYNDCYMLVNARLHCSPDEVIDEEWFEDWDRFSLWEYGFLSFLSFALFRAQYEGSDWQDSFNLNLKVIISDSQGNDFLDIYDLIEINIHNITMIPRKDIYRIHQNHFRPPSLLNRMSLWYMTQDWYNPTEWHDNLD